MYVNENTAGEYAFGIHGWINLDQAVYVEELANKYGLTNTEIIRQLLDDHKREGRGLSPKTEARHVSV